MLNTDLIGWVETYGLSAVAIFIESLSLVKNADFCSISNGHNNNTRRGELIESDKMPLVYMLLGMLKGNRKSMSCNAIFSLSYIDTEEEEVEESESTRIRTKDGKMNFNYQRWSADPLSTIGTRVSTIGSEMINSLELKTFYYYQIVSWSF
jgi:hypothetical protein